MLVCGCVIFQLVSPLNILSERPRGYTNYCCVLCARRGLQGQPGGAAPEPSGPGVAEVTAVDKSIVMVLKPNELAKKKRKFKQVR